MMAVRFLRGEHCSFPSRAIEYDDACYACSKNEAAAYV